MQGISALATIISVFTFSLTCIVVLYPTLSRFKSRWKGIAFYGSISAGTLLVAALTAPDPALPDQNWSWVDWTVLGLGVGTGIAVILNRSGWLRQNKVGRGEDETRSKKSVNKKVSRRTSTRSR